MGPESKDGVSLKIVHTCPGANIPAGFMLCFDRSCGAMLPRSSSELVTFMVGPLQSLPKPKFDAGFEIGSLDLGRSN